MAENSTNGGATNALAKTLDPASAKAIAKQSPKISGFGNFGLFLKYNMPAVKNIAAKHLDPNRILKILINCVGKVPALQNCTNESILRSCLQAVELGLEPGSALGQAYLVPYGQECTLIVGYRGLVDLAFRSNKVKSVRAKVVYQGDKFEYEDGLNIILRHVPSYDAEREPAKITHGYCVVTLKDGGVLCDVMTRSEIDAIRKRSKAGSSGPWVTDYAEMAKKTVARRCLKYAPMSIEMSKAFASDDAVDMGDNSYLAEFETIEDEGAEDAAASSQTKTQRTKEKIGDPIDESVLIKTFKLTEDQVSELRAKVETDQDANFGAFLTAAKAKGCKGFADLLNAISGQETLVD